jgi:hypothetical protein
MEMLFLFCLEPCFEAVLMLVEVETAQRSSFFQVMKERDMKKMKGTYYKVLYILLSLIALILAVGAPETTGW